MFHFLYYKDNSTVRGSRLKIYVNGVPYRWSLNIFRNLFLVWEDNKISILLCFSVVPKIRIKS